MFAGNYTYASANGTAVGFGPDAFDLQQLFFVAQSCATSDGGSSY